MYGIIYMIKNTVNNKIYFGQTISKRGFEGRYPMKGVGIERVYGHLLYNENSGRYHNSHLLKSIKKYGFGVLDF